MGLSVLEVSDINLVDHNLNLKENEIENFKTHHM